VKLQNWAGNIHEFGLPKALQGMSQRFCTSYRTELTWDTLISEVFTAL